MKQETLTQVCRQDGTCQTTTATEYITVERFTSETLASQMGTVTSDPVKTCIGPVCTWTTTTVISTVGNAYGADEWYLPEASGLSTFVQFELVIKSHMTSPSTIQQGTYGFVKDSKVFFNSTTNNAVVVDDAGNFVTGFKLSPGTLRFDNFIKNGVLR